MGENSAVRRAWWRHVLPLAAVLLVLLGASAPATHALARSSAAAALSGRLPGVAHLPDGVVTHEVTASGRTFVGTSERSQPLLTARYAIGVAAPAGRRGGPADHHMPAAQSHSAAHRSRAPPA